MKRTCRHRGYVGRALCLIVIALCALAVLPLRAQTITTKTVDIGSGGRTGQYASQAIVNGNPAVAYYNESETSVMFARNSAVDGSGTWSVSTVDFGGDVGEYTSLAVVNGNPAISYYDHPNGDLKYVRALDANGTSWGAPVTVVSSGDVGLFTSLVLVNGNPAIGYYDQSNDNLAYVRALDASGTSWGSPVTLDSVGQVGWYLSMAVVNGNPAVSYYDVSNSDLKYVRSLDASGSSWGPPVTLDSTGSVGAYTSLAVVAGNPAISYYNGTNGTLKYMRALDASGTSWGSPVTAVSAADVGQSAAAYTFLTVVNGNPAMCYHSNTSVLKYVRALDTTGTSWGSSVTLENTSGTDYSSLMVVAGRPAVCYQRNPGNGVAILRFNRANDASGTSWPAATTADAGVQSGDVGLNTSQAIVNGNPAISYYDFTRSRLKYVRALDPAGTIWGTPVIVDNGPFSSNYLSLAVVAGNPAISYQDANHGDVKYVRALDAAGTTWGTPVTAYGTASTSVAAYISMAVVNGNPAFCSVDDFNGVLFYVRALNSTGTSWGTPVTVVSTGVYGDTSLAVVNGNPAISYYGGASDLIYVRALDASGTSWGSPVTIASTGNVGGSTSLAVVNGNPAISYRDATNGDLNYVRAQDASGTSWGAPAILDSIGNVGQYTSLAVVNGNPAVGYYDTTNSDLKYVRGQDASGTSWGAPVTLDSIGTVGEYASLAVVNGNAAISYYDRTSGNLKWATYLAFVPDIAVAQASPLTDGGSVDFATVTVGSSSAAKTFTITNPGTGDLTSLAVSKDGTNPGDFTVSTLSTTSIPVGAGTATFTVTFTPSAGGTRSAALHIASNVTGTKNPFDIAVTGTGQTRLQAWKLANLGDANAPDAGNPDMDAFSNLAEYGLVLVPTAFSAGPVTGRFTYPEGNRLRVIFTRDPARNDVTVAVLAADDLNGPWTTVASSVLGAVTSGAGYYGGDSAGGGLKTVEVRDIYNIGDPAHPRRFLRFQISY